MSSLRVRTLCLYPSRQQWGGSWTFFYWSCRLSPSPCSSVFGLHCTGPTKRETIAMGDCYILCGRLGVTWPLGCASSAMRAVPFLPQGVARRSYRRPLTISLWLGMLLSRVSQLLVPERSVLCPLSWCVLSLRLFFETTFAVILVEGSGCGTRTRPCGLLLGGSCPSVPRRLPLVLCGGCAGQALVLPGPARLETPLLTNWKLALGPCFLVGSPTIRPHPMGCHGWRFVYVSTI